MENLSKQLEQLEKQLEGDGRTPTLLLHCCCAPCSSSVLERLTEHFAVTVYYYNPNISPADEYDKRLSELKRLICEQPYKNPVRLLEASYEPTVFYETVRGLENEPERGKRCRECFMLRLGETARAASEGGFDYFTTTLSVSPLKDAQLLYETACIAGQRYKVAPLVSDFKKKDGFKRSIELSAEYGLYRQNYCGCVFSKRQQQAESGET